MNKEHYSQYYDPERKGLNVEEKILSPEELETRRIVEADKRSWDDGPVHGETHFYRGFISAESFPETYQVGYLIGKTGPETQVNIVGVKPAESYDVLPANLQSRAKNFYRNTKKRLRQLVAQGGR